ALSGGLAACGGGGGSTDTSMMPTPQEMCEDAGGRYNADGSCSSAAEVMVEQLQAQINGLRAQLGLAPADNLGDSIADLQTELAGLRQQIRDMEDDEAEAAMQAAMETARKLHAGISAQSGAIADDGTGTAETDRDAAYNADHSAIWVSIGGGAGEGAPTAVSLSEDEDTMVADNHGWSGTRYARTSPASEGSYEAIVYSNVEAPTMGRKFGNAEPGSGASRAYEYDLADGVLTAEEADGVGATDNAFVADRVALTGVTRTAGTETFHLPSPNPGMSTVIDDIYGSYHGVSGTYRCDPTVDANGCSAAVAADGGFTLGGGTWSFVPNSAEARVTEAADSDYVSYGWWLHKSQHETTFTASAFVDEVGTVTAATGLTALNGTATYVGGAAGKYALHSTTGGTNDAGHFTARATLEANFTSNTSETAITGTIDRFIGADDMTRDWEVTLTGSQIGDDGMIGNASPTTTNVGTVWTIGDAAAEEDGNWTGALQNTGAGTGGVPQVATGTFYTGYGTAGRMVGAFGANLEE
ncbi:MAG: hypothetical protein OXQ29_19900, partial [Rhodospirillaceae bacterium]|nr:hypothetical protein [Rhodospirillaceae bacterium]